MTRIKLMANIRFILGVTILSYTLFRHFYFGYGWSVWPLYIAAAMLFLVHFRAGSVWMAAQSLFKGDIDKASQWLEAGPGPKFMAKRNKAYYFFAKGLIALHRKELQEGAQLLQKSLDTGLARRNEQAMSHLNLAQVYYVQKDRALAEQHIWKARNLEPKDLLLSKKIEETEDAISKMPVGSGNGHDTLKLN